MSIQDHADTLREEIKDSISKFLLSANVIPIIDIAIKETTSSGCSVRREIIISISVPL